MPKSVLVHGCYHIANYGDGLIAGIIAVKLLAAGAKKVVCPVLHPFHRQALPMIDPATGLSAWLGASAVVFGGGGYLNDHDGDPRAVRRLLRYTAPARLYRAMRIPYIVAGVGAGPLTSPRAKSRVRSLCRGAAAVAVRDEVSKAILVDAGVSEQSIGVTADWALTLTPADIPSQAVRTAEALLPADDSGTRFLGLHLESLAKYGDTIEQAIRMIGESLRQNSDLVPVWFTDFNDSDDLLNRVTSAAATHCPTMKILRRQNLWVTTAIIARMDAVITSKLHVGIVAAAMGVPPFGISTHQKTKRFYAQIGREQYQVDYENQGVYPLDIWISHVLYDGMKKRVALPDQVLPVRQYAESNIGLLAQLIDTIRQK